MNPDSTYVSSFGMFHPEEPHSCECRQQFPNEEDAPERNKGSVGSVVGDGTVLTNLTLK